MSALVDLHVHSWASPCSTLTPLTVGEEARARGLDGVAVVDHERLPDPEFVADVRRFGVRVYAGAEVATADGDLLVFGLAELPRPGRSGPETARWVWERGGAVVAAHPFRRSRLAASALLQLPGIVLEERNGRCREPENRLARLTRLELGCAAAGGSDAHDAGEVGMAATRFEFLPQDERELVRLLRAGRCASWSPAQAPDPAQTVPFTTLPLAV